MSRFLLSIWLILLLAGCTEEQQNRLTRLGITWLEGNYRVTYADGQHVKSWEVRDSKVTSEPDKGYYFFLGQEGRETLLRANPDRAKLYRRDTVTQGEYSALWQNMPWNACASPAISQQPADPGIPSPSHL
jgi:hypothetical protein